MNHPASARLDAAETASAAFPPASAAWAFGDVLAQGGAQTSRRLAQWMEQALAAQVGEFQAWTDALRAALDSTLTARHPRDLLELQAGVLASALQAAAQRQTDAVTAWVALQGDLASQWTDQFAELARALPLPWPWVRPPVSPDAQLATVLDQANAAFDQAVHEWHNFWMRMQQHPAAAG